MWVAAWKRSSLVRFWRTSWVRRMLLAGVGLFLLGALACVVQLAFNGHHKSGQLYALSSTVMIIGDMLTMLSIITFCIVDIGSDIIQIIHKFRKRP